MSGYNELFWQDIDIRVDPDPFCTSCQISTFSKKPRSKTPLNPNTPFKSVFMDSIPAMYSKILTKDTTFYNYILIVDTYSKLIKLYVMEKINIEELMDKQDMFQSRFGKLEEFDWWD